MIDTATVQCPYCFEWCEVYVEPDTNGQLVQDCEICCRPWNVFVHHGEDGELHVTVDRAQ